MKPKGQRSCAKKCFTHLSPTHKQYNSVINLFSQRPSNTSSFHSSLEKNKSKIGMGKNNSKIFEADTDRNSFFNKDIVGFVEEVGNDPSIINRLIDYGGLADYTREKIQQQKRKIDELRSERIDLLRVQNQLIGDDNESQYSKINKLYYQIAGQIKEIMKKEQAIDQQRMQKQNIIKEKKNKLIKEFQQRKKYQKQAILQINANITNFHKENAKINQQINEFTKKSGKYGHKYQIIEKIKVNISEKMEKIKQGRVKIGNLKKEETQALKKYKQSMANKMSYDQSLNKNSERKLKQFIENLKKIIEKNQSTELESFAAKYNITTKDMPSIRSKNSSSNTQPQENEDSQNLPSHDKEGIVVQILQVHDQELKKLQNENPALKTNKNISIQNLDAYYKQSQGEIQNNYNAQRLYDESIKNCDKKISQLNQDQMEKDAFITKLKEKLLQLDEEIKDGTILQRGLKRTSSFVS